MSVKPFKNFIPSTAFFALLMPLLGTMISLELAMPPLTRIPPVDELDNADLHVLVPAMLALVLADEVGREGLEDLDAGMRRCCHGFDPWPICRRR